VFVHVISWIVCSVKGERNLGHYLLTRTVDFLFVAGICFVR